MASSSKFDTSSCSPDRPSYSCGQRGASQLDRSGSFSEVMEGQMLNSIPNMARTTSAASPGDIINFLKCLRFDPKMVAAVHKSNRQVDFKRHIEVALGLSTDDSTFSRGKNLTCIPEEIKRVKVGLRDSTVKARERVKIFNEALSVYNKFFHSVPSKKRSRLEGGTGDRPGSMMSNDRPFIAPGASKVILPSSSSGDFEQKKSGERIRHAATNKRTRTSLVDTKTQAKLSTIAERDRELPRPLNSAAADDRATMPIGVDNWEKSKLKKKRSGMNSDIATSSPLTKSIDSCRDMKPGIPQRPSSECRSRFISDSHIFRTGAANGAAGVAKLDTGAQIMGMSPRLPNSRTNLDSISIASDRKERPAGAEKDRFNLKASNKASACDDFNSSSPTSNAKGNANVRAPRSGGQVTPKLSPTVQRVSSSNDWELSHCANKPSALVTNHRKRSASTRSPSPPVVHWASQRPQKISRTARRTNLIPIMPSNDDNGGFDAVSDASGNDVALGIARRIATNASHQAKLKGEPSATALSDSEESGAPEIKSVTKERQPEVDEKAAHNVQKLPTLGMPSRKNKLVGEDMGDGMKKGRNGRIFASTRLLSPVVAESFGTMGTGKQLRSGKHGFEKIESKIGRPPTRKISDRKACPRQKHALVNATAEVGHEELLVAASSVLCDDQNASKFWREMDRFFGLIHDSEIDFLKQQGHLELPSSVPVDGNECRISTNSYGYTEEIGIPSEMASSEFQKMAKGAKEVPLFQRLIAAIIPENDYVHGCDETRADGGEIGLEVDELGLHASRSLENSPYLGSNSNGSIQPEIAVMEFPGDSSHFLYSINGFLSDRAMAPDVAYPDFVHGDLQICEKLKLEVQSVGIVLEQTPSREEVDGGIFEEIKDLEYAIHEQVSKRKGLMERLLSCASESKELQEKDFERRALDKLVTIAYGKHAACRGSSAAGGKSSGNKLAKLAAASFVKKTLDQCHKYEETGNSCFSEAAYNELFLSRLSRRPISGAESSKMYISSVAPSSDIKCSVSGSQPSPRSSRGNLCGENSIVNSPDVESSAVAHETDKNYVWSQKMRKELLLDDVGGPLSASAKGKRSERDRDAKGQQPASRVGRHALSNAKGERKTKTKPKQKTGQLSVSVNGVVGNPNQVLLPSDLAESSTPKAKDNLGLDVLNDPEAIVLSNLLDMDDDGQGHDLGAWLNIDDDGLQDNDSFMGLEIPMDDLSDLKMMV